MRNYHWLCTVHSAHSVHKLYTFHIVKFLPPNFISNQMDFFQTSATFHFKHLWINLTAAFIFNSSSFLSLSSYFLLSMEKVVHSMLKKILHSERKKSSVNSYCFQSDINFHVDFAYFGWFSCVKSFVCIYLIQSTASKWCCGVYSLWAVFSHTKNWEKNKKPYKIKESESGWNVSMW